MAAGSAPRLQLQDIKRRFGAVEAVAGVNLTIDSGEIVCLLGPSGCGKTTTLRIAAGVERPDDGRVVIGGAVVAGGGVFVPPERRSVGLVFQDYALFPHLNVTNNVGFGLNRLAVSERARRVAAALERVKLTHLGRAFPHELSGGEQQRVALARALAPGPQLMLMDEPFSGLDRELRTEVRDDTVALLRQAETATLLVTHDPAEALEIADRVILMRNGRVEQDAAPEVIWRAPVSAWAAGFLGETNSLSGLIQSGRAMTPWGAISRPGLKDGPGQILVRPGDVQPGGGADPELVIATGKYLGGAYLIAGTLVSAEFGEAPFRARIALPESPRQGSRIRLRCEPNAILIFSTEA